MDLALKGGGVDWGLKRWHLATSRFLSLAPLRNTRAANLEPPQRINPTARQRKTCRAATYASSVRRSR